MKRILPIFFLLVPFTASHAYTYPVGIPTPGWAWDAALPDTATQCPSWPAAASTSCYYVDNNAGTATDSGNTNGYPDKPRRTIPNGSTYAAGSYIELHNTSYPGAQLIMTLSGTEGAPCWIVGKDNATLNRETILKGAYVHVSGITWNANSATIGLRQHSSSNVNHVSVRNCVRYGTGTDVGNGLEAVSIYGGTSGGWVNNIVIDNITIRSLGDWQKVGENDFHGVKVGSYADNVWVLDSTIYHMGGDSVQIGEASIDDSTRPHHVYIGGGEYYENHENALDIKEADNVVVSSVWMHKFPAAGIFAIHNGPTNVFVLNNLIDNSVGGLGSTGSDNLYVMGNVFRNIHHAAGDTGFDANSVYSNGMCVRSYSSTNQHFVGNTLYDYDSGILALSPIEVRNNIFADKTCDTCSDILHGDSSGSAASTVDFNLFDNAAEIKWSATGTKRTVADMIAVYGKCTSCITADPLFMDNTAGNFRLQATSPAIDNGTTTGAWADFQNLFGVNAKWDIDNTSRPQTSTWDVDAYEYVTGIVTDNTAPSSPTDVTATATGAQTIHATWSAATDDYGVTGYNVYANGSLVGSAAGSAALDIGGLNAGTLYAVTVKAYDAAGNVSAESGAATATTLGWPVVFRGGTMMGTMR